MMGNAESQSVSGTDGSNGGGLVTGLILGSILKNNGDGVGVNGNSLAIQTMLGNQTEMLTSQTKGVNDITNQVHNANFANYKGNVENTYKMLDNLSEVYRAIMNGTFALAQGQCGINANIADAKFSGLMNTKEILMDNCKNTQTLYNQAVCNTQKILDNQNQIYTQQLRDELDKANTKLTGYEFGGLPVVQSASVVRENTCSTNGVSSQIAELNQVILNIGGTVNNLASIIQGQATELATLKKALA